MKILVIPDSFKGTISSVRFCQIAEIALCKVDEDSQIVQVPMADGGEGTVDALVLNTKGRYESRVVRGPLGAEVEAKYGILGDGKTAVIEMAAASGITLVDSESLNPMLASTFGTGQLILDALQKGCSRLIMGIGGSATNDCGMGMLEALGFRFLDKSGRSLSGCGRNLVDVATIDDSGVKFDFDKIECLVACDVNNPLCGVDGATYTYGRQKGASEADLQKLETGMRSYNKVVTAKIGADVAEIGGAGAAGGLGAGLIAFLNGELRQGFSIISEQIDLENKVKSGDFDLIVTGEGQMNWQTTFGKLPMGVAKLGQKFGVPVIAVVGSVEDNIDTLYSHGLSGVFSAIRCSGSLQEIFATAEKDLEFSLVNIFRVAKAFCKN